MELGRGRKRLESREDEVQQPVPVTEIGGQGVAEVIVTPDLGEDRHEASEAAVVEVTMAGNVVAASTLARTLEQN